MARLVLGCGILAALFVFVVPALAGLAELLFQPPPLEALGLGPRRSGLLIRGVRLALLGGGLAQVLGGLLAFGWLDPRPRWLVGLTLWLALATLLTPAYVIAYALSLPVLPEGLAVADFQERRWFWWLATEGRCLLGMAICQAPLAAGVLTLGWWRGGAAAVRLARLDAGMFRALLRAGLPTMLPWLLASWGLTVALLLGEFALPHLSLLQTYNTELLAEMQNDAGRARLLAWPLLVLLALVLAGLAWLRTRLPGHAGDLAVEGYLAPATAPRVAAVGVAALVLLTPPALLVGSLDTPRALWLALDEFPRAWPQALLVALLAGVLAALAALAVEFLRTRTRGVLRVAGSIVLALAALALFAPPVLVGDVVLVTWTRVRPVSDSALIVGLSGALRFGLIACVLVLTAARFVAPDIAALARLERAGPVQVWWRVRVPLLRPALLAGALLVGVLAMTEVAASQMVNPPGAGSLAVTLLNQIHFGRRANVIALCLHTLGVVAVVALLVAWLVGRFSRRDS